jgi:fluoride exporter
MNGPESRGRQHPVDGTRATRVGGPLQGTALLYAAVAVGSAVGGTARWVAAEAMLLWLGAGFPWGTLFANVTGSALIGFYAALTGPDGRLFAGPVQRQFVMSGICGGYTTFSIFSLETLRLLQTGRLESAGLSIAASAAGWLLAVWLGYAAGMRINRLRR